MITKLEKSHDNIIGFEISGKVSIEEEKKWIDNIKQLIDTHKKLKFIVVLNKKAKWGIEAGLSDLKFCLTHIKNFDKIAIVSDSTVWKALIKLDSQFAPLVGIKEKHFESDKLKNAWDWIEE